ncbi:DUF86 domain-containing protein [Methanosarcina sp. 1.H.A.2.2]|uniref:type VII toxin-antitoxin system HepT family RNase toxin n=1 Tax=Methanosarcina sp. 1.H.A.2.2 TaxID=1483601 RepID=UPI00062114C3|nr:DUF86 domain-containing protein [Methanosarcina sp. 1.H.A.2.2]KKH49581.1 hypothetical protein EO93_15635 [Methanosarcina sp. 1.H.A.2.2]
MIEEINFKLEQLGEYVSTLREYQPYDIEEIRDNRTLRGAVERYMEVSLACMIDICEMIVSSEKLRRPDTYREVILVLGQHEILPEEFARKLAPAAGFRNVLVHMYADIDLEKLYSHLQNDIDNLELFAEYIAKYLISKYD